MSRRIVCGGGLITGGGGDGDGERALCPFVLERGLVVEVEGEGCGGSGSGGERGEEREGIAWRGERAER